LNAASSAAGEGEILTEELIKGCGAVAYAAGADTSVSTLTTFFLAMTLHPEAQKRAQAELDVVVGDRLPTFADKASLPYVMALMKEVLRWIPVLPMAVPHRAVNSDQYKGYFIPAGASILGNTWYAFVNANAVLFFGLRAAPPGPFFTTRAYLSNRRSLSPNASSRETFRTLQIVASSDLDVGELGFVGTADDDRNLLRD